MSRQEQRRSSRNRNIIAAAMSVLITGILSGCGSNLLSSEYSSEDPLVLRYADYTNASSGGPMRSFASQVNEETDERIEFKEYWGGSLLGTTDMASGIRGGVADLGMFTATYYGSEFPFTEWLGTLASVSSTDYPDGTLEAYAAHADFAMNSELVNHQFEDRGMKLLFSLHTITKYDLICTTPVTSLADAKGKRVRSGGPPWDQELQAAGMVPVNVDITETYEGLQRGVIDCALASPKTVTAYSLWDVAKHYTQIPLSGVNTQYAVMNRDQWDGLTEEDRDILWDAGFTWWLEYLKYEGVGLEEKLRNEGTEDKGVDFLKGNKDLVLAIEDQQAEAVRSMPISAPETVSDPEAVIDDYEKTMSKWLARVKDMHLGTSDELDLSEYERTVKRELWNRSRP